MNMKGEIVGINALIVSRISESAGIGLAIRGDIAKKSVLSMLSIGRVDRPAIGIMIMELVNENSRKKIMKEFPKLKENHIPNTYGIFVRSDKNPKGIKKFDTIVAINDIMTNGQVQFSDEISKYNVGDIITLTVIRKRRYLKVDIPLKVFPVDADALYSVIRRPTLPIVPENK